MAMNESVVDKPDPGARLSDLTNLATPFAIRVAVSLGVADRIADGVTDLDALATACGADRDALARLLRYLAHRGVFAEPTSETFALTEIGELLCERSITGKGTWLDLSGLGARMDLAYGGLLHTVRTGEPGYATVHGHTFWGDLDAHPPYRTFFDELMRSQQRLTAPQVAAVYDWDTVTRVVDVGGGSGGLIAELLTTHPHLRGTVVDRPEPIATAERRFHDAGVADRGTALVGDFFEPLPAGADVYVISRALTDWNDESATAILRRCAEAAGTGGRVLIVEVLPTDPYVPHLSTYDLEMLVLVGGRERGEADHVALAADAGLRHTRTLRGRDGLTLIEFTSVGR